MKQKTKPFVRLNSRVNEEQLKFIKDFAKKKNMTEGEVVRYIITNFISKSNE